MHREFSDGAFIHIGTVLDHDRFVRMKLVTIENDNHHEHTLDAAVSVLLRRYR
jgi:hypothetical protein